MVRTDTFQQGMEIRTVVRMSKVAEFVEEHIVPEFFRQPYQIEIQVDIPFSRATAPVGNIVFDPHLVILE